MRKLMLMVAMVVFTGLAGFSQPFEKGSQAINLGIGLGNVNYWGSYYEGFLPSISASYEYGIVEVPMGSELTGVVSVGGYVGASFSKIGFAGSNENYATSNFVIAARGNYHFIFHDKLDPYAGIALGVDISSYKWKGDNSDPDVYDGSVDPFGGAYAGARWYFSDNFAAYAEVGWLISVLNLGVTFKIK
jgi:hypothetical protein